MLKRFVSLILAVISCLMLCVPAFAAENINFDGESGISPLVVNPTTANIFRIEQMNIYPAVLKNGKETHLDEKLTASSGGGRIINATLSAAKQQQLIDYAESLGYEVIGWYMEVKFYMYCYRPHTVAYRTYSHDQNGGTLWGVTVSRVSYTATIGDYFLFPTNTTGSYTYGFDGYGIMTVYDGRVSHSLEPEFFAKITFANN